MDTLCEKCNRKVEYEIADTWWDYTGSNYDTKLTKCPYCGAVIILEYREEPNRDLWQIKRRKDYY